LLKGKKREGQVREKILKGKKGGEDADLIPYPKGLKNFGQEKARIFGVKGGTKISSHYGRW